MRRFLRTYGHSVLAVFLLITSVLLCSNQRVEADAATAVPDEYFEARYDHSIEGVPAESIFNGSKGKNDRFDVQNGDVEGDVEVMSVAEEEIVGMSTINFSQGAGAPMEVITVARYTVTPEISDFTNAVDYANALGFTYEQTTTETIYDVFSAEDIDYICRMVQTETNGAPFLSKVYVAEVAFYRYFAGEGRTSLKGIITSPSQFSYWRTSFEPDTLWAVEYAFQYATETQNARYFRRGGGDTWYKKPLLLEDSVGHRFYGEPCDLAPVIIESVADGETPDETIVE